MQILISLPHVTNANPDILKSGEVYSIRINKILWALDFSFLGLSLPQPLL